MFALRFLKSRGGFVAICRFCRVGAGAGLGSGRGAADRGWRPARARARPCWRARWLWRAFDFRFLTRFLRRRGRRRGARRSTASARVLLRGVPHPRARAISVFQKFANALPVFHRELVFTRFARENQVFAFRGFTLKNFSALLQNLLHARPVRARQPQLRLKTRSFSPSPTAAT